MYLDTLKQIWPYIRPYRKRAIASFLFSFVMAVTTGFQVKLVKPIFDHGLQGASNLNEVLILAATLLGLAIINFPARFYHFYWLRFVVDRANCDLREILFKKMQRLPTAYFSQNKQGRMLSAVLNDTELFAQSFRACVDVVREPIKGLVFFGMAIIADWQLTMVVIFLAPLLVAIFQISGRKIKANQHEVQEHRAEFTHNLSEGLSAHKVTKAFNLQNYISERFKKAQDLFFDQIMKMAKVEELAHPLVELVGAMAFSGVIVFAYFRIKSGATTIGDFIQFIAAMALLMDPIRKFSQANVKIGQGRAAGDRILEILNLPEERETGTSEVIKFSQGIEVKNVSFGYGEQHVIQHLNVSIKKGQKIALVGLSGSGKSTLINLLLGLYPIEHGSIEIDGRNITDFKLHSLRSLFGLVSQDIFLFHDSIRENLTLGREFSEAEIQKALEVSYAKEFVDKLPHGLNTIIGDRGAKLSGGQQQRLTIARAFLQNTEILLFDEATSALDNESEKVVQKALDSIAGTKTVIAVAHRLSTIQDYDLIYVMHSGKLVEKGTHHELIAHGGEYAKLYELSSKS